MGEFILIDRVTNMTSACGVVENVNAEEHGLYEGRVDRKVRAAVKGQTAVTIEFIKSDKVNRAFVEDVEKAAEILEKNGFTYTITEKVLHIDGRHTYLYAPAQGEDISLVLKHLHRAGIVVLLLVDKKQADSITNKNENYITNWSENGTEVEEVAAYIRKQSVYGEASVRNGNYI